MSHDGFYTAVLELSSVNCGTKGAHRLHCTSNSLTRFKGSDQRAPRSGGIRSTERVLRDIARVYFVRTAHPFDAIPGGVGGFDTAMSSKFSFLWQPAAARGGPPSPSMLLHALSDDLLRHVLLRVRPCSYKARYAIMLSCRRLSAVMRLDEVLNITISCSTWATNGVGFEPVVIDADRSDALVAQVSIDAADEQFIARHFDSKLAWAIEMCLLAHRRTAASCCVDSLSLIRRHDLQRVLAPLMRHLAGASSLAPAGRVAAPGLTELTLSQCMLPTQLARLLPSTLRRMRLWDCPWGSNSTAEKGLVASLSSLPNLQSLVWASQDARHYLPLELLEAPDGGGRWPALCDLALHADRFDDLGSLGHSAWDAFAARPMTSLVLLGELSLPASVGSSLLRALSAQWHHSLRVLHLAPELLSSLCSATSAGSLALIEALPPSLEKFGGIDCSWLAPGWFFEALYARHAHAVAWQRRARPQSYTSLPVGLLCATVSLDPPATSPSADAAMNPPYDVQRGCACYAATKACQTA